MSSESVLGLFGFADATAAGEPREAELGFGRVKRHLPGGDGFMNGSKTCIDSAMQPGFAVLLVPVDKPHLLVGTKTAAAREFTADPYKLVAEIFFWGARTGVCGTSGR